MATPTSPDAHVGNPPEQNNEPPVHLESPVEHDTAPPEINSVEVFQQQQERDKKIVVGTVIIGAIVFLILIIVGAIAAAIALKNSNDLLQQDKVSVHGEQGGDEFNTTMTHRET